MKPLTTSKSFTAQTERPVYRATRRPPRPRPSAWNAFLTGLSTGIAATLITLFHPAAGWLDGRSQDAKYAESPVPQADAGTVAVSVLDTYEALKKQVEESNQRLLAADQRVFELEKQLAEAKRNADDAQGVLNGVLANIEQKALADSQTKPKLTLKELARQLNPEVVT